MSAEEKNRWIEIYKQSREELLAVGVDLTELDGTPNDHEFDDIIAAVSEQRIYDREREARTIRLN